MNAPNKDIKQVIEVTTATTANAKILQGWILISVVWNGTATLYVMGKTTL